MSHRNDCSKYHMTQNSAAAFLVVNSSNDVLYLTLSFTGCLTCVIDCVVR